jgi:hypothetical protein
MIVSGVEFATKTELSAPLLSLAALGVDVPPRFAVVPVLAGPGAFLAGPFSQLIDVQSIRHYTVAMLQCTVAILAQCYFGSRLFSLECC